MYETNQKDDRKSDNKLSVFFFLKCRGRAHEWSSDHGWGGGRFAGGEEEGGELWTPPSPSSSSLGKDEGGGWSGDPGPPFGQQETSEGPLGEGDFSDSPTSLQCILHIVSAVKFLRGSEAQNAAPNQT